jgi:ABC-2 type transport system ATP-binding protein
MDSVLTVTHLTHDYGSWRAITDLSLDVQPGEVLGLLGPNGAGKTTTIRLVNGMFPPTSGRIEVLGLDPVRDGARVRQQTGVLTETPALYERLTARQNLVFFGRMNDMPQQRLDQRVTELLHFFELDERADERVGAFSKGMKQRLALARALLHEPRLLFLDEPTSGLDPEAALQVHSLINRIRSQNGQTVVLCTHHLEEAEHLCDRLAIIHRGCLLALGSLDALRRNLAPDIWASVRLWQTDASQAATAVSQVTGVLKVDLTATDSLHIQVSELAVIPRIVTALSQQGLSLLSITPEVVSLEQIYFQLQNQQRGGSQ